MAILESASTEQLRRLLELFPSALLKAEWPGTKGFKKVDACEAIAGTNDSARVKSFLVSNFAHCRQHVLLPQRPSDEVDVTTVFPPSEPLGKLPGGIEFRLTLVPYTVYLLNPMQEVEVNVLWPFRIEYREQMVIIRFIVLERDPSNYSGRISIKAVKEIDEKKIIQDLGKLGFLPLDINKGVKALWSSKFMDAFRASFKKSKSTSTEVMDGEIGLRENAPEVYEELTSKPLLNTNFRTDPSIENSLGIFQVNATFGRLGFTSYTDNPGDSDAVIDAIITGNS